MLRDTVPLNEKKSEREVQLEQQVEEMRREIDGLRKQLTETEQSDLRELSTEIEKLQKIEEMKVLQDLNVQMKRIAEINARIQQDMEPVDIDIDMESMQSTLEIAQLEMQKSLKEVERVREIEMKQAMDILQQSMRDIKFDKSEIKRDMDRMKKEMDIFKSKMDAFKVALTEELRKDGVLGKSERLQEMEVRDGDLISVNGKKIKSSQSKKYDMLLREYLGETDGNFSFKE